MLVIIRRSHFSFHIFLSHLLSHLLLGSALHFRPLLHFRPILPFRSRLLGARHTSPVLASGRLTSLLLADNPGFSIPSSSSTTHKQTLGLDSRGLSLGAPDDPGALHCARLGSTATFGHATECAKFRWHPNKGSEKKTEVIQKSLCSFFGWIFINIFVSYKKNKLLIPKGQ